MNVSTIKHTHRHHHVPVWKRLYIRFELPLAVGFVLIYILFLIFK